MLWSGVVIASAACSATPPPVIESGATSKLAAVESLGRASCADNGCLRSATKVEDQPLSLLAPTIPAGLTIDNGFSVYTVRYLTGDREATATVAIPIGVTPPEGGYHIVSNNHGTTGLDDPCAITGVWPGIQLAGLFGARGMIGVATEYPGVGTDGILPYLVSEVEGAAVLDALRAATALAEGLEIPLSGRYATGGVSQGAHATIAAAAIHRAYAPELDMRGFLAVAPPTAWEEQWRGPLAMDGPHVHFYALVAYAWSRHYGWTGPSLFAEPFASDADEIMSTLCSYSESMGPTLQSRIGDVRANVLHPDFQREFSSGEWSAYREVSRWFSENRLGPYRQHAPLRIYHGADDVILPQATTEPLARALMDAGFGAEHAFDYVVVPGAGHLDLALGFLSSPEKRTDEAIQWIRDRLAGEGEVDPGGPPTGPGVPGGPPSGGAPDAGLPAPPGASPQGAALCSDACRWAGDGECDDGGPRADYAVCLFGTDCDDCGPRRVSGGAYDPYPPYDGRGCRDRGCPAR